MENIRYYYMSDDEKALLSLREPFDEPGYTPITEEEFERRSANEPQTTEEIERNAKLDRIDELKRLLAETDYQAIKYAEGELSAMEYDETKQLRRAWRAEINELEAELE